MRINLNKKDLDLLSFALWHYELVCMQGNNTKVMRNTLKKVKILNYKLLKHQRVKQ